MDNQDVLAALSAEELKEQIRNLQQAYSTLENELAAVQIRNKELEENANTPIPVRTRRKRFDQDRFKKLAELEAEVKWLNAHNKAAKKTMEGNLDVLRKPRDDLQRQDKDKAKAISGLRSQLCRNMTKQRNRMAPQLAGPNAAEPQELGWKMKEIKQSAKGNISASTFPQSWANFCCRPALRTGQLVDVWVYKHALGPHYNHLRKFKCSQVLSMCRSA